MEFIIQQGGGKDAHKITRKKSYRFQIYKMYNDVINSLRDFKHKHSSEMKLQANRLQKKSKYKIVNCKSII